MLTELRRSWRKYLLVFVIIFSITGLSLYALAAPLLHGDAPEWCLVDYGDGDGYFCW